jgi:hypothetical protein
LNRNYLRQTLAISCVATYRLINCAQFRPNSHLVYPPYRLDYYGYVSVE